MPALIARWTAYALETALLAGLLVVAPTARATGGSVKVGKGTAREWFSDARVAALADAAASGRLDEVDRLIAAGVPVDGRDGRHMTPLAFALLANAPAGVERLLARGANPNHRIEDQRYVGGWPIVLYAVLPEDPTLLRSFLEHGADPNTREPVERGSAREFPYQGDSLLHCAVAHLEQVKLLVARGADVNLRPRQKPSIWGGDTAAERAATIGRLEVVEFLVAHGAKDLDEVAHRLQDRRWAESAEPRRVKLLRELHQRGAKIYASALNPQTPPELITPGKWKPTGISADPPVPIPDDLPAPPPEIFRALDDRRR